jgi:hypothetical protein
MHCISVLGSGYNVVQEEKVKSFGGSIVMKHEKTNFLLFLSKGKHRCISPPLGILLYNYHYVIVACAFMLQELNEILECNIPFVYHLEPI